jgi:hypothetical protein
MFRNTRVDTNREEGVSDCTKFRVCNRLGGAFAEILTLVDDSMTAKKEKCDGKTFFANRKATDSYCKKGYFYVCNVWQTIKQPLN